MKPITPEDLRQWRVEDVLLETKLHLVSAVERIKELQTENELQASIACAWAFALGQLSPYRVWIASTNLCGCEPYEGRCSYCAVEDAQDALLEGVR